jgi:hypothetical protein
VVESRHRPPRHPRARSASPRAADPRRRRGSGRRFHHHCGRRPSSSGRDGGARTAGMPVSSADSRADEPEALYGAA